MAEAKVVVVGAGVAGLTCARSLRHGGVDVSVVEARSRVGGRTWSETLANGAIAERGGEYFDESQVEVHQLANELGLGMVTQGFNASVRGTADPNGPSLDELEQGAALLCDYWASLGDIPPTVSIQQVIASSPLENEVAAIIRARLSSGRAADVARVSARWSEGGSETPRVTHRHNTRLLQGNQVLSERMADDLGDDRVVRRWPVAQIRRENQRYVVVGYSGETRIADAVVIALPVPVVKRLPIDGVDPRTSVALSKLGFGQATKLHLTVVSACAPGIRQETLTPFSTWATAGPDANQAAFVTGFGSTHETQSKLAVTCGSTTFRPLLEAQWPGVRFGEQDLLTHWGGDPWTGGAYSYRPLGWTQEDQDYLARPSDRVFFAGEHTADLHTSSICGAIRSGYRAADEVLAIL